MNNQHHSVMINMPPQYGKNLRHKIYMDDFCDMQEKFYYAFERLFMIIRGIPKKYSQKNLFKIKREIYHPRIRINKSLCTKKLFFNLSTTLSLSKITRNKIYI